MESQRFNGYEIADISDSELNKLSELEKSMCTETNKDIVLIAYQNKVTKTNAI